MMKTPKDYLDLKIKRMMENDNFERAIKNDIKQIFIENEKQ